MFTTDLDESFQPFYLISRIIKDDSIILFQTFMFTDTDDEEYIRKTGEALDNHFVILNLIIKRKKKDD